MSENLERAFGRVEGKLDMMIERLDRSEKAHTALSKRVTSLEGFKFRILGICTAVAIFSGVMFDVIKQKLGS